MLATSVRPAADSDLVGSQMACAPSIVTPEPGTICPRPDIPGEPRGRVPEPTRELEEGNKEENAGKDQAEGHEPGRTALRLTDSDDATMQAERADHCQPKPAAATSAGAPSPATAETVVDDSGGEMSLCTRTCLVCLDAAADAVLVECGHGGLCAGDRSAHLLIIQ